MRYFAPHVQQGEEGTSSSAVLFLQRAGFSAGAKRMSNEVLSTPKARRAPLRSTNSQPNLGLRLRLVRILPPNARLM
jgi:hypothetical protein